jgi:putative ABC transport system ATP-binding protein
MSSPIAPPILAFLSVTKTYPRDEGEPLTALRDVTFEVPPGHSVAIVGRSGSGKSTLLHLAAGIEWPSTGEVRLLGRDLSSMGERERTLHRRRTVGLIFQFFHLVPHLDVLDNILLPAWIASDPAGRSESRARELLARVGLEGRARDSVRKLSGGEMQRVALCRALLREPKLLLADEPTGSLDDENGRRVMEQLLALSAGEGSALIYVTHSRDLAAMADEIWNLHSGVLDRSPGSP